ncbi:MAG TPA: tripartite tricarboxylate transporter TctB family protein [Candidatus Acidoferrales bacterium]|nr:tripartite tricarboxylate transporter TctB family protein [Candidatus Acidoferrales bacterium]
MKFKTAELALSVGTIGLGIGVALETARLPTAGGYAGVGPNVIPGAVAAGLILLGVRLLYEALSGGWRALPAPPEETGQHAFYGGAFVWVSIGLFAQMLLIHRAGFVIAGAVLFTCVARAFGSPRFVRDAAIGFALTLAVFFFFVHFLNVGLPAGWLEPILGTAGV